MFSFVGIDTSAGYQATPNIPGMPSPASLPPPPTSSSVLIDVSAQPIQNQPSYAPMQTLPYNMQPMQTSGPSPITTPIALPGMPPITVSATLPQNAAYYSPVLQNPYPNTYTPTAPPSHERTA